MLQVDIPYLEPLWIHLREDEVLKQHFTDRSYFMPHSHLIAATEEAMKKDCPAPRALWILPGDSLASTARAPAGCKVPSTHTFYIQIIVQCIRDAFQVVRKGDSIGLDGQFMELSFLRSKVKESVLRFSAKQDKSLGFENIIWRKDSILYPSDESSFLATASEFNVTIF